MIPPRAKMLVLLIVATLGAGVTWFAVHTSEQEMPADVWANRLLVEDFAGIQKLIKPQPGESRWMEVPWQTSLWEARQMAAAQGKPIFVWFGRNGPPACHT